MRDRPSHHPATRPHHPGADQLSGLMETIGEATEPASILLLARTNTLAQLIARVARRCRLAATNSADANDAASSYQTDRDRSAASRESAETCETTITGLFDSLSDRPDNRPTRGLLPVRRRGRGARRPRFPCRNGSASTLQQHAADHQALTEPCESRAPRAHGTTRRRPLFPRDDTHDRTTEGTR